MGGSVNIGGMKDRIILKYLLAQTTGTLGGKELTYTDYDIWADVRQIRSDEALTLGMDMLSSNFRVKTRPPAAGRPALVEYDNETYKVIAFHQDKVGQFIELIMTKNQ